MRTLVLLDVHAILHRAYHALPDFTTKSGVPTGGLYGLTSMLIKLANELKPDYLAACYDLPEPTFRKVAYADYKAGRKPTDSALVEQIEHSRELFQALGIPIYEHAGFEADDMIGTIVEQGKAHKDVKIIIASGDLDTLQLVKGKQVQVYTFKKGLNDTILYDETAVGERFGFAPTLLPDWKGLRGDPSDNIIGITGIGEKTATKLVSTFGSLEKIYTQLKKDEKVFKEAGMKDRVLNLLREGEEEAIFSKTLAVIRRDAPIQYSLPEKVWRDNVDRLTLDNLLDAWEFRTMKERLDKVLNPKLEDEGVGDEPRVESSREAKITSWLLGKEVQAVDLVALRELGLEKVYQEIELPLLPILDGAHKRGITVDTPYLKKLAKEVRAEIVTLEKKIAKAVGGGDFNLNSPKQLAEILFDKLQIPVKGLKKTAGGARSTRESELLKLADRHPVVKDILLYREKQKALSTYIEALPRLADSNGVLHTTFDQTGAATGRLSSRDPNLQNIPTTSSELGQKIRQSFIARPRHKFVALDYAQIEMRVLAGLSGDEVLIKLFQADVDIHRGVAARVFGVKEEAVTDDMRRQAKVINFGIIYGMGVNALRANLGTDRETAAEFHRRYFETFPRIKNYFDEVIGRARRDGYTTTHFGRRRSLPLLLSPLPRARAEAERQASNAPVQGTAADLIKLAMIKAESALRADDLRSSVHLLLTIHDELLYEVEEGVAEKALPVLRGAMETVTPWPCPLKVKITTGSNWAEL